MEFRYLLKERVCALVIKLFSPNVKHHSGSSSVRRNTISNTGTGASSVSGNNSSSVMMMGVTGGAGSPTSNHRGDDRPHYAITVRLLRLVSILVRKYHKLLVRMESINNTVEIFYECWICILTLKMMTVIS